MPRLLVCYERPSWVLRFDGAQDPLSAWAKRDQALACASWMALMYDDVDVELIDEVAPPEE